MRNHVAWVDVHKEILGITILRGELEAEPEVIQFTCQTFTEDLMGCGMNLKEYGVNEVAMESTGVYWRPL